MKDKHKIKRLRRERKKLTIKKKLFGTPERPRLAVFRSTKHIYAQLIDDQAGQTILGVSTLTPTLRDDLAKADKMEAAKRVGVALAEAAKSKKIKRVVFDRSGYLYHGRVRALAEGAREGGLEF